MTARWGLKGDSSGTETSSQGPFPWLGSVLWETLTLLMSSSKQDGIYIYSEDVFYFWQLPHCRLDISEMRPFRFSEARNAADKTDSELSSSALLT